MSLKKHFEGWQLAIVTLTIAWGTALVVVPRSVPPDTLPLPRIDPKEAEALARQDTALSQSVILRRPDGRARRLGSNIRAYGAREAQHDQVGLVSAKTAIEVAARAVSEREEVVRLRAYQTDAFLRAMHEWVATGDVTTELEELAGNFIELLETNEWVKTEGHRRVVLLDDLVLRAIYKKRWNDLVGLGAETFEFSSTERRALAGFLLAHPPLPPGAAGSHVSASVYQEQARLRKIEELEKFDPTYPALYAKGIVLYRLGAYQPAAEAFSGYIEGTPNGAYRLRATNYLRASLDGRE